MSLGCNKKLKEEKSWLICSKCNKQFTEGIVRYKVVVRVLDKTGDVPFLLWDREVAELVGISAFVFFENFNKVQYF